MRQGQGRGQGQGLCLGRIPDKAQREPLPQPRSYSLMPFSSAPTAVSTITTATAVSTITTALLKLPGLCPSGRQSQPWLCGRRWGDSPLRYAQNKLFLNYTSDAGLLDFIVDYGHDKVTRRQLTVTQGRPVIIDPRPTRANPISIFSCRAQLTVLLAVPEKRYDAHRGTTGTSHLGRLLQRSSRRRLRRSPLCHDPKRRERTRLAPRSR